MCESGRNKALWIFLILLLVSVVFLNLRAGSVWIPWQDFREVITTPSGNTAFHTIVWEYRFPKLLMAIFTGAGLGLAGLFMQTLFRNPVAGPYILGLSGGSGLAVALLVMGSFILAFPAGHPFALSIASAIGSLGVLATDIFLFRRLKQPYILLIAGLMIGAFSGALLSLLTYFTPAQGLQKYMFWTMGNLGNTGLTAVYLTAFTVIAAYILSLFKIKYFDLMLLGDDYVKASGVNLYRLRMFLLLVPGIVTGIITAFTGPIAFAGLIIPHLGRIIFKTELHRILIPAVALLGSTFMLSVDTAAQLPGSSYTLPLNAITALIGAPSVVYLLLKRQGH
jgi:iron complex transport system permease protein